MGREENGQKDMGKEGVKEKNQQGRERGIRRSLPQSFQHEVL